MGLGAEVFKAFAVRKWPKKKKDWKSTLFQNWSETQIRFIAKIEIKIVYWEHDLESLLAYSWTWTGQPRWLAAVKTMFRADGPKGGHRARCAVFSRLFFSFINITTAILACSIHLLSLFDTYLLGLRLPLLLLRWGQARHALIKRLPLPRQIRFLGLNAKTKQLLLFSPCQWPKNSPIMHLIIRDAWSHTRSSCYHSLSGFMDQKICC